MMRRGLLLAALAVAACCLVAPLASAATNEVRPCGTSHGWKLSAGNFPPKLPTTKCSFARATDSAVRKLKQLAGSLPKQFSLKLKGQTLSCTTKNSARYAEVRCKNPRRFVLIYKFK